MIKCPKCSHENVESAQICEVCGQLLVKPSIDTRKYDDADYEEGTPRWGSARFNGAVNLGAVPRACGRHDVIDRGLLTWFRVGLICLVD